MGHSGKVPSASPGEVLVKLVLRLQGPLHEAVDGLWN